jgi:hypothetical protein
MKKVIILAVVAMFGFTSTFAQNPQEHKSASKEVKTEKHDVKADTSVHKKCCAKGEKKCTPEEKKKCEAAGDKKCCKKADGTKSTAGEQKKCCKKQGMTEPAEKK